MNEIQFVRQTADDAVNPAQMTVLDILLNSLTLYNKY